LDKGINFSFEPYFIKYMWIESKKYLPDFVLDNGILLEVKGRFTRNIFFFARVIQTWM
jgi:hypothetical protein